MAHQEGLQMDSKTNVILESFPKFSRKSFFVVEMLVMDGCSKNSNNLSYKTPMDQQWQQCGTKVKINDRYSPKQDWVRQKTSK